MTVIKGIMAKKKVRVLNIVGATQSDVLSSPILLPTAHDTVNNAGST